MASDTPESMYNRLESIERKTCWVCFATEEEDPYGKWVQPCRCKGTTKWVHTFCLQRLVKWGVFPVISHQSPSFFVNIPSFSVIFCHSLSLNVNPLSDGKWREKMCNFPSFPIISHHFPSFPVISRQYPVIFRHSPSLPVNPVLREMTGENRKRREMMGFGVRGT